LGFTALLNPVIMGTYPFGFTWLYLKAETTRARIIQVMSLMLIILGLVTSPWLVRNYLVFGQFAFIKSNFGNELYLGTKGDIIWERRDEISARGNANTSLTETEQEFLKQANEVTRNGFLFRKALGFIAEHPLQFAQQTIIRVLRFWTYMRPQEGWIAEIPLVMYLILILLAGFSLLLRQAKSREMQLVLLFLISLPLPYYFTLVNIFRYRFPIEPLLIIFASYTIYRLIARAMPKSSFEGSVRQFS
jgi:hypothetical protein